MNPQKPVVIKSDREIEGIRRSSQLAARCLKMIESYVVEGVTTNDLNERIADFIVENGAIPAPYGYAGYPAETCISLNEVICHGIPNNCRLQKGDILNIDVTTILDGFYGDTSRMYTVGEVSQEAKKLLEVARRCLEIGIEQIRPENRTGLIGYEIAKYAESLGYGIVHQFCGHGVGIGFHESPQIPHKAGRKDGVKMRPGMIFTVEPMVNIGEADAVIDEQDGWTARTADGSLSAQYEHTILVTPDGAEVLTKLEE
jgi:methionyl aminopeptidase